MTQQYASTTEQRLADEAQELAEFFSNDEANLARMPESIFRDGFLPMFAGEDESTWRQGVSPALWMRLAHGPYNEVIVVNEQDQELFRVPAWTRQDSIKPLDHTGKSRNMPSITDMVMTARNFANRGQQAVDNFIHHEMARRSFMFADNVDISEETRRWIAIFKRYNVTPKAPVETPINANGNSADVARDSSEFDPL